MTHLTVTTILYRIRRTGEWNRSTFTNEAEAETFYIAAVASGAETLKAVEPMFILASGNVTDQTLEALAESSQAELGAVRARLQL